MIRFILLGTAGCHLCEQAESIINDYAKKGAGISIESIDIAEFEVWQAQYATRIPVLYHPETETDLGWPFDRADVKAFIEVLRHD